MDKFEAKTEEEIRVMAEGGKILAKVKKALLEQVKEGSNAYKIEILAEQMIRDLGARPSFEMVPGYRWATCVNVNKGLVHGIPTKEVVFKKGDVVSVDLGVFHKGFHTDSSFSKGIGVTPEVEKFLKVGEEALEKAISKCKIGNRIYDISGAIESTIKSAGYTLIRALVGHGVGRHLHEEPQIPCFVPGNKEESIKLSPGIALAIEVMYAMGAPEVVRESDGWTISMRDGKISALFEETVAVTAKGPLVLTSPLFCKWEKHKDQLN